MGPASNVSRRYAPLPMTPFMRYGSLHFGANLLSNMIIYTFLITKSASFNCLGEILVLCFIYNRQFTALLLILAHSLTSSNNLISAHLPSSDTLDETLITQHVGFVVSTGIKASVS